MSQTSAGISVYGKTKFEFGFTLGLYTYAFFFRFLHIKKKGYSRMSAKGLAKNSVSYAVAEIRMPAKKAHKVSNAVC